ncbi:Bax inhibitor-1/YccA family protein [Glaciecola sp.]|nr:Bax inhibitor-1/YccA family protein [Glaciecola sp.]
MNRDTVYAQPAQASVLETNKVLRNTYMLLSMTLVFSAFCAAVAMYIGISPMMSLGMTLGAFVMLFVVNKKADSASGLFWIFAFTGLLGGALGPMLTYYAGLANGPGLIMQALGGTAIIFFALSGYVLTTKKDFSFMGGFLMVGLLVVVIAAIANIFFAVPAVSLAISSAIIFIMSGLILFDTSRIIHGGETNYIRATVSMYLNLYNLFTSLLHLLGVFNSDD